MVGQNKVTKQTFRNMEAETHWSRAWSGKVQPAGLPCLVATSLVGSLAAATVGPEVYCV